MNARQIIEELVARLDAGEVIPPACLFHKQMRAILAQPEAEAVEFKRVENSDGSTMCVVKWMATTPNGWIGAWDKPPPLYLKGTP